MIIEKFRRGAGGLVTFNTVCAHSFTRRDLIIKLYQYFLEGAFRTKLCMICIITWNVLFKKRMIYDLRKQHSMYNFNVFRVPGCVNNLLIY